MNFNRKFWEAPHIQAGTNENLICPCCKDDTLFLGDQILERETGLSCTVRWRSESNEDLTEIYPEKERVFIAMMECRKCEYIFTVKGMRNFMRSEGGINNGKKIIKYFPRYNVEHFDPSPVVLPHRNEYDYKFEQLIIYLNRSYWSDFYSCLYYQRVIVDEILSDMGLQKEGEWGDVKESYRSVSFKSNWLKDYWGQIIALFSKRHKDEISHEKILDGFELIDIMLRRVYCK
ncbi:hypothetical protein EYV94_20575 [Puteibacter caeruleilacunae]|nr:hypothetical protein EYV94_20575 [Puteibacter caeruleilacunae]